MTSPTNKTNSLPALPSLYGKENRGVIKWILDGKLLSVDKAKAQSYISASALNADATYKNELSSAAKIVVDFENPVIRDGNFSGEEENNSMKDASTTTAEVEEGDVLYREVNVDDREQTADNVIKEERHSDTARQSLTQRETVLRDSLDDLVRSTGIEVIEDVLEGQHVLGMAYGHAQLMSFESRMTMRNILLDAVMVRLTNSYLRVLLTRVTARMFTWQY